MILYHYQYIADATTAYFGQGSGSILLNSVGCSGSESRLIDCSYSTYTGGCSHSDDAGVQCQSSKLKNDVHCNIINI